MNIKNIGRIFILSALAIALVDVLYFEYSNEKFRAIAAGVIGLIAGMIFVIGCLIYVVFAMRDVFRSFRKLK